MKLFIRDHLSVMIFFIIQSLLVSFLYWMDGFHHIMTIFYLLLLSNCMFLVFFLFRYWRYRRIYQRLSDPLNQLEDSLHQGGNVPLEDAMNELLHSQYRHYQDQIHDYEKKQQEHVTFITQWVHQMKTPLSVIQLTLQNKRNLDIKSIREEMDRIKRGLDLVLYTARLDVFERDFHVEPVSLRQIAQKVIQDHKRFFIQNNVYPELQIEDGIKVESDAKWLSFIINQLVTNAVKYSLGSGGKVILSSYHRGRNQVLEIQDQGVGIPKQDLRRVFDPYYTGENGRTYSESTGMGLYLVKEVCKKLQHRIELESDVGKGTTLRLLFFRS